MKLTLLLRILADAGRYFLPDKVQAGTSQLMRMRLTPIHLNLEPNSYL